MRSFKALFDEKLLRQARLFEAMTDCLRRSLPLEASAHCWVGGVRDRVLVVVTDSACFAVAPHYQQHEILKRINSEFRAHLPAPLTKLKTKVAKVPSTAVQRRLEPPTLSADAGRGLASVATHIADPDLKSVLTRLAKRASQLHR